MKSLSLFLLNLVIATGCQSYKPTESNMVGVWVVGDAKANATEYRTSGTQIQLLKNGTFLGRNIDPRLILTGPASRSSALLDETSGTWTLVREGFSDVLYFHTTIPKHSRAFIGVPSKHDGTIMLEIKANHGTLNLKRT